MYSTLTVYLASSLFLFIFGGMGLLPSTSFPATLTETSTSGVWVLSVGTSSSPVEGVTRLTCEFSGDFEGISANEIELDWSNSWFAESSSDVDVSWTISGDNTSATLVIARTDETPVSGYGELFTLGTIETLIIDDVI